jgi:hypothetical protein
MYVDSTKLQSTVKGLTTLQENCVTKYKTVKMRNLYKNQNIYFVYQLRFFLKDIFKIEVPACCTPLVSLDVSQDTANYKLYSCGRILFKHV